MITKILINRPVEGETIDDVKELKLDPGEMFVDTNERKFYINYLTQTTSISSLKAFSSDTLVNDVSRISKDIEDISGKLGTFIESDFTELSSHVENLETSFTNYVNKTDDKIANLDKTTSNLEERPNIYNGSKAPDEDTGKSGDIYIQYK